MKKKKIDTVFADTFTKVRFYSSAISGIKKDNGATIELSALKDADYDLVGVNKKIFGRDINKEFRQIQNEFRNRVLYPMTYPWSDGGKMGSEWRIVSNEKYDSLMAGFETYDKKFWRLVEAVKSNYEDMIDEGMKRLGKLANISDYKEWEDIEHKFNFQITPDVFTSYNTSNDTRVNLSEKQRKAIENSIASNYEANFKSLLEEEKKTLEESVQNIIDALKKDGSGKSFFKDSVFKNLKEKVERVRDLNRNIYQSAELDKAIDIIVGSLASVNDIDSLRDKGEIGKSKRAKVSADMEKAKSSLNQNTLGKIFSGTGLSEGNDE
tara:strand:- start:12916 stop:13884 length:969 start_codon:yes stop_codon:yes gene_type:complete